MSPNQREYSFEDSAGHEIFGVFPRAFHSSTKNGTATFTAGCAIYSRRSRVKTPLATTSALYAGPYRITNAIQERVSSEDDEGHDVIAGRNQTFTVGDIKFPAVSSKRFTRIKLLKYWP